MATKSKLSEDLAALAGEERSRSGERPTAEQLIAYRDGSLPADEAERLRDLLAVDPELASLYLDLKRATEEDPARRPRPVPDPEVDTAWDDFRSRLDERPVAVPPAPATPAGPRRRRRWRPFDLALAATFILAVGIGGWLVVRNGSGSSAGAFHEVQVAREPYRGGDLEIPGDAAGIRFLIDLPEGLAGPVRIELRDSRDEVVAAGAGEESEAGSIRFEIPIDSLDEHRAYRLTVRPVDAAEGSPVIDDRFRIVFEPGSKGPNPMPRNRFWTSGTAGKTCVSLGRSLERANEYYGEESLAEAVDLYRLTLAAARAADCPFEEARAHNGLGLLASRAGRLHDGVEHLRQARKALDAARRAASDDAARRRELDAFAATLEHNLGSAYFRLGLFGDARDAVVRLRGIQNLNATDADDLAETLLLAARVDRALGQPHRAAEAVREALEILGDDSPRTRASLWQEQARLDLEAGRWTAAENALARALTELEGLDAELAKANVVVDLAELRMRQERWRDCLREADRTLTLARGHEDLSLEAYARHLRSVALQNLGDLDAALRSADGGLALLEAMRGSWQALGIKFFAWRTGYYRHRLDLAIARRDAEDAWTVFETYRARGLLESLGRPATAPDPEELALRRQILDAVHRLDAWDPATGPAVLERLDTRLRALRRELRDRSAGDPDAAGTGGRPELGPKGAAGLLEPGMAAVAFAGGVEDVHVLVLDPSGEITHHRLDAERQELATRVAGVVDSLDPGSSRATRSRLDRLAGELGRLLLPPTVAERLRPFQSLAIVADGPLEGLPFEILRLPGNGRRLVDTHEIVYLPSFSVLADLRDRAEACSPAPADLRAALVAGDPILSSRDPRWPAALDDPRSDEEALLLQRVAATASEARAIADLYPPREVLLLLAGDATRERLLEEAPRYRVIHLASHGSSDREIPERSKIALSCVDSDGRAQETCDLYFTDVAGLELCGQTVVLSACETAGGPSLPGEGVLGLPRAFLRAGASTVVASLWRVPDRATASLMADFHRRLHAGDPPAAALRAAKLERIAAGDPESSWAAFVILGDWRPPSSTFSSAPGPME